MALFAALSYAVTQSGRGGGTIGKENASLVAAQMIQYAGQIGRAITRLKILSSCSDTTVSFENTVISGYTNASSPADKSCHVFDAAGGSVVWQNPPANANDGSPFYISGNFDAVMQDPATTTPWQAAMDLIVFLPFVTQDVCVEINKKLMNSSTIPDMDYFNITVKFAGSYGWSHNGWSDNGGGGKQFGGCMTPGTTYPGKYFFFYVVLGR